MAFVIRSNRNITFTNNDSGVGPGQYFEENTTNDNYNSSNISMDRINNSTYNSILSKKKNATEVPFNTTSLRAPIYNTDDFPGPGAYGPSTTETYNSSNIDNLKQTGSSYYTNNLTLNSENKGFLTSSKRFDFDKFKFNNNYDFTTYYNDNLYNNTVSSNSIQNNNFKKKLKKINYKSFSNERVCSIPTKENFGYNINKNGDVVMAIDPDKNIKLSGLKENSAGPGQYNLNLSWNKGQIKYKPEKKINKQKEIINELKNNTSETSVTTYTEKMKSLNQSNLNNNVSNSSKIEDEKNKIVSNNNNNNNNPRNKIFHEFLERKNKNHKKHIDYLTSENNIIASTQKKYTDTPGPGFYEKEYKDSIKNQFKHSSILQNFGSSSPKSSEFLTNNDNIVGPGEYFKEKNKYEKKINNNNFIINNNKPNENFNNKDPKDVGILMSNLRKNNVNKIIGPGQYNLSRNFIKKNFSNLHQFNSTNPRFKEKQIEPKIQYSKKDENNKKYLIQPNPKILIKNETEEEKFISNVKKNINKDNNKNSIPAVGTYNPGIAYSIEYQNSKKMNPHQSFIAPFNTINNRFGFTKNEFIGPGIYNFDIAFNKLKGTNRQFKIFGEDEDRFKNGFGEKMFKNNPGPGNYNISNSFDWNKKTFNVLFKSK